MEFLIPSRTTRPGDDPILALNAEARARAAEGRPVLNATVGALLGDDGRLAVLPTVSAVLREVDPLVAAGYAPIAGSQEYLGAVIRDLLGDRPDAKHALAVATPGGSGALRHAIANLLEPGQSLLTTSFYWGPYQTIAQENDRHVVTFRMFDDAGRLDVGDFAAKLSASLESQGRALVFLNSPCHNPTGYSFDDTEWDQVVEAVRRSAERGPVSVVIDIAYARYGRGMDRALDRVLALAGPALVLFAWSASKSFTQYGARVGALIAVHPDPAARSRLHDALVFSCRGTWSNCNAAGMAAITRLLLDRELAQRVDAERAVLKGMLDRRVGRWNETAKLAGLTYPRYDGGFFTTVFCDDAPRAAAQLRTDGIFVVPQAGALRVALCSVAERDIERLAIAIARVVG